MSSTKIYSTNKIAFHGDVIEQLRRGENTAPVMVQMFPSNICNQACDFCSYGSGPESIRAKVANPDKSKWKNQQLFAGQDVIPRDKMIQTIYDLAEMGCKAIEVSGGGEPTLYPWFEDLISQIAFRKMDVALVTNGTRMTPERIALMKDANFVWARVSIDAGSVADYTAIRHCPPSHWNKAWETVANLAAAKTHPEAAVGVGFVVDRINYRGIYEAVRLAKDHGADNVRLSMSFTPDGTARWREAVNLILEQAEKAVSDFHADSFKVYNLIPERINNVVVGSNPYPYCFWKDVGCVIGADQKVYACCSWAYNKMGLMGSIENQSFKQMWNGEGLAWRRAHDPRRDCRIQCLYYQRNLEALKMLPDPEYVKQIREAGPPPHVNYL